MPANEPWVEIVPKFIRLPMLAYQHRKFFQAWAYRGLLALGWGRTDVVVLGRPGAGKSVLLERLTGRGGELEWTAPDVSTSVESAVLTLGQEPLIVRTIPGQDSRERDNGLHEALSSHKKLKGVIYVADWGFNAPRDEAVRRDRINRFEVDNIEKLRIENLQAELRDFATVVQRLKEAHSRTNGQFWLLVIVNKADLFFDRLGEAEGYYHPETASAFNTLLADLTGRIGANSLHFAIVPVCAWSEDFEWNNEVVRSSLGEREARALFLNMRQKLKGLVERRAS